MKDERCLQGVINIDEYALFNEIEEVPNGIFKEYRHSGNTDLTLSITLSLDRFNRLSNEEKLKCLIMSIEEKELQNIIKLNP